MKITEQEYRALEQRADAAEARSAKWKEETIKAHEELETVLAKLAELAELEKQKPFMYGIMTANGDAYFEEFCVSSDQSLLEDEILEWNNSLSDNEPKNKVVALYTRPAPAINLAELVPDAMPTSHIYHGGNGAFTAGKEAGWNACRAAILANLEGIYDNSASN